MRAVKEFLKQKGNRFNSMSQIALGTSLSFDEIETSLLKLRNTYHYKVKVNKNGELLYKFNFKKRIKRSNKLLKRFLFRTVEITFTGFIFIIPIMVMSSIFYYLYLNPFANYLSIIVFFSSFFLFFLAPWYLSSLISKIFTKNPHPVLRGLPSLFNFFTETGGFEKYKFRQIRYGISRYLTGQKPFDIAFYFKKKIIKYLKLNNYEITAGEVVKLTGYSFEKAEDLIVKILFEFEGEIKVNKKRGIVIYSFPYLQQNNTIYSGKVKPIWEEFKKEYEFNKNPKYLNILIFSNLSLTLFFSTIFLISMSLSTKVKFIDFLLFFTPFMYSFSCLGYYMFKKNIYNKSIKKFNELIEKSKPLRYIFKNLPFVKPNSLYNKSIHDKHLDLEGKPFIKDKKLQFQFERLKKETDLNDKNVA